MYTAAETLNLVRDKAAHALATLDFRHHEIHEGDHYYLESYTSLNIDGVLKVALVTPDTTKWIHLTWQISSNGITVAKFYEDAEGVSGGSAVTPLNNNRNSSNSSGVTLTSGVSTTGDGTLISSASWGGEGFKSVSGGGAGRGDELILKQNTTYLRVFESATDNNVIGFKATWYEHTNEET